MLGAGLGRAVLTLAAVLFVSRAAEELFWFRFNPAIFAACLLVGGLYLGCCSGLTSLERFRAYS